MGSSSSLTIDVILAVSIVGIIIFIGITSLLNRKNRKKEKQKRKVEVREKIKTFIREKEALGNLYIEFEKVVARRGKEWKNRDVFEVIINLYDAKTRKHIEDRAYEIEGISIPIDKRNYKHQWVVNARLDIENTRDRMKIMEGEVKLTKEQKEANKKHYKELKKQNYLKSKEIKKNPEPKKIDIDEKFAPKRKNKK